MEVCAPLQLGRWAHELVVLAVLVPSLALGSPKDDGGCADLPADSVDVLFGDIDRAENSMLDGFDPAAFGRGLLMGAVASYFVSAGIVALPASLALVATVGVGALAIYNLRNLYQGWDALTPAERSEVLGAIVGAPFGAKAPLSRMLFRRAMMRTRK